MPKVSTWEWIQLWREAGGSWMSHTTHLQLSSAGPGSTSGKSWKKEHFPFLGEPEESREMEPFPGDQEGWGFPPSEAALTSYSEQDGERQICFQGSGWGDIYPCPAQSNSHPLEDSGKSFPCLSPALTQTFLSMQLLQAGLEGILSGHIHPKHLLGQGLLPGAARKHLVALPRTQGLQLGPAVPPWAGAVTPVRHTVLVELRQEGVRGGQGPGHSPEVGHGHTWSWVWWSFTLWRICFRIQMCPGVWAV